MEKKTKLTISGTSKKPIKSFDASKNQGKKTVVIEKKFSKPAGGKGNFNKHSGSKYSPQNFKKSNFTIFKSNEKKHTYASAYKRRNLDSNSLNEISTKIIGVLKKEKIIKKGKLVKIEELVKFESKKVLIEIKWLVKEGYVSEFANGNLSIN